MNPVISQWLTMSRAELDELVASAVYMVAEKVADVIVRDAARTHALN